MSEIVNSFFRNLYIINILGGSVKIMCKNYKFMCEIFITAMDLIEILLYILCKYWAFKDVMTDY